MSPLKIKIKPGLGAQHRGSVRASHQAAQGSNLGTHDFLTIKISSMVYYVVGGTRPPTLPRTKS